MMKICPPVAAPRITNVGASSAKTLVALMLGVISVLSLGGLVVHVQKGKQVPKAGVVLRHGAAAAFAPRLAQSSGKLPLSQGASHGQAKSPATVKAAPAHPTALQTAPATAEKLQLKSSATPQVISSGPLRIMFGPAPAQTSRRAQPGSVSESHPTLSAQLGSSPKPGASVEPKYGNIPMSFVPNHGQVDREIRYQANGRGYKLSLESSGATLSLARPAEREQVTPDKPGKGNGRQALPQSLRYSDLRLEFLGANPSPTTQGLGVLPGKSNYFLSSDPKTWYTNIPTFAQVQYKELYPGVNLVYYGNQQQLEYDFVVAPGSDPKVIALQLLGAREAHVAADGSLLLAIDGGEVRLQKPVIYQKAANGQKENVDGGYVLEACNQRSADVPQVRFRIGSYDPQRELIIDPVLAYSAFANGFTGVVDTFAADAAGDAYLASTNGDSNLTITKLSPDGTTVIYTTVLGTSGVEAVPEAITLDASGDVYFTGWANPTYPTTSTAYQTTYSSGYTEQPFVTMLDPTGANLLYSSFLAGTTYYDYAYGIAVDSANKIYIAGQADATNFPTTAGAFQTSKTASSWAAFVAKFDPTLSGQSSLVYSTLLNGTSNSYAYAVAVDSSGDAYITGQMDGGFPKTSGAFDSDGEGAANGGVYVTELNPQGSQLVYSAFLGPGTGVGIAVDGSGSAYVTGSPTYSDFPTTSGAYQTNDPGGFVTKLSAGGSTLVYSTFLSGPSLETTPTSLAIAPNCASNCNAYVAGYTTALDFPTINSVQSFYAGGQDDFFVELSGDGSTAVLSTYLGGSSTEGNDSYALFDPHIALDGSGDIFLAGGTSSSNFPVTLPFPFTSTFIAKISPANASLGIPIPSSVNFGSEGVGIASSPQNILLRNMGNATMTISSIQTTGDYAETDTCSSGPIAGGGSCTLTATFTPTEAGTRYGTITITDSGTNSPNVINLQGTGVDGASVNYSPTTLNFGAVPVGTPSTPQTTTVSNIGNKPLTISQIYISPVTNYSETNNCPEILAPGASCAVSVVFTPTQPGDLAATLTDSDNGYGYGHGSVSLTGTGTVNNDAMLTLSAASLNFQSTTVGSTSSYEAVTATSSGSAPVTITGISVTGDFALYSTNCSLNANYPPGNACNIYVDFKPSAAGTRTGTLTITDNTSGSPHLISLSGNGLAASSTVSVTPATVVFGNQLVGTESSGQVVYVYNTGTASVTVDRIVDTSEFPTSSNCSTIAVGSYCTFYVYFQPAASGVRSATISIIDSASGSPQTVAVSGTGVAASSSIGVVPTTTALSFNPQLVSTTSGVQTFYLYNTGDVGVTFGTTTLTGANAGDFAVTYNGCTGTLGGVWMAPTPTVCPTARSTWTSRLPRREPAPAPSRSPTHNSEPPRNRSST